MSIQNWTLEEGCAVIVCDSLATNIETKQPHAFMSKAWVVPHRAIMVAAKDWAYPTMQLYSTLAIGEAPSSLDDLIAFVPDFLAAAASRLPYLVERPETRTVLFGWSEADNRINGWTFHADRGFVAEPMPLGAVLAPSIEGELHEDWYAVALRQQRSDRLLEPAARDNIGGWLLEYQMRVNRRGLPPTITIKNLGKLPHHDVDARAIEQTTALCV
jgi:hypothetical protein